MPTPTYIPLANITLGSAASSVTFSSIPATYRDLVVSFSGLTTVGQTYLLRVNNDSGSNYSWVQMRATTAVGSSTSTATHVFLNINNHLGTTAAISQVQILDYSATDKHKNFLVRNNYNSSVGLVTEAVAVRWANTNAITSVQVSSATSMAVGTTIALYGIQA